MKKKDPIYAIVYTALMAAVCFVLTLIFVPLGESKVHFGNVGSMLSGLLLGPWLGGLASGIGAFFFDLTHGYGIIEAIVTFVSKFLMAMVAGLVAGAWKQEGSLLNKAGNVRVVLGCILGGLTYIALYMLKTYIKQRFVAGIPLEGTWATMLAKLPATAINNGFAAVVTPILYTALRPALNRIGVIGQLRPER